MDGNADARTEPAREGCDVYRYCVNTPAFPAMLPDEAGRRGPNVGSGR